MKTPLSDYFLVFGLPTAIKIVIMAIILFPLPIPEILDRLIYAGLTLTIAGIAVLLIAHFGKARKDH